MFWTGVYGETKATGYLQTTANFFDLSRGSTLSDGKEGGGRSYNPDTNSINDDPVLDCGSGKLFLRFSAILTENDRSLARTIDDGKRDIRDMFRRASCVRRSCLSETLISTRSENRII